MTAPFLTKAPLDLSDPAVRELLAFLEDVYFRLDPVVDLLREVNISPAKINLSQSMSRIWVDVLTVAANQGKLTDLVESIAGSDDKAVAERVKEIVAADPVTAAPPSPVAKVDWPAGGAGYEKIVAGRSTLLDVTFLERGVQLAPAVVRLLVTLDGKQYYGTASRIASDLFLTNHHVLFSPLGAPATAVEAWFGYERTFGGQVRAHVSLEGDPSTIQGAADHDWAVVRIPDPIPDGVPVLDLTTGATVAVEDRVYVIQHPFGGVKKIGMVHNVVRSVTDDVILYWADTDEGSSGSPVFDEQWRVVGLHHYWTTVLQAGVREIRNQGVRIERVVEGLRAAGLM